MAVSTSYELKGWDELASALRSAPDKVIRKGVRKSLRKGGQLIVQDAKHRAPVLKSNVRVRHRKPGTVRDAIQMRSSKFARQRGDEGVFINVRPINKNSAKKLGKAGAKNPNDPYYWRWQEFGWIPRGPGQRLKGGARRKQEQRAASKRGRIPGKFFLTNAAKSAGEQALRVAQSDMVLQIEKLNQTGLK